MKNSMRRWAQALSVVAALALGSAPVLAAKPKDDSIAVLKDGRQDVKPKISSRVARVLSKAYEMMNEEKFDEALAELDKLDASKLNPSELAKVQQYRGNLHFQSDRSGEAAAGFKAAIDANGLSNKEHLEALRFYGQLLAMDEKFAEAVVANDAYFAAAPSPAGTAYIEQANNYYELENWDKAAEFADKALASGEKPQNAWYQIKINSLYQSEKYPEAIAYLKELLAQNPADKQFNNMLVSSYLQTEDYQGALDQLLQMKQANLFDSEMVWKQLYQLYLSMDKPLESAAVIEEGIASGGLKANEETLIDLGEDYYVASGDVIDKEPAKGKELALKSLDAFTRAAAVAKTGIPEMWRCQILIDQDRAADAATACAAAVAKGGLRDEGNAHYLHGVALFELGKMAEARTALQKATGFPNSKRNAETMLKNLR